MPIFSWLRRTFFPTPAEMMQNMTGQMQSMAQGLGQTVGAMQTAMNQSLAAQGFKPCAWCLAQTRGEQGGTMQQGQHVLTFCSQKCRHEYGQARMNEFVQCGYCHGTFVRRANQCTHCGAARPPGA